MIRNSISNIIEGLHSGTVNEGKIFSLKDIKIKSNKDNEISDRDRDKLYKYLMDNNFQCKNGSSLKNFIDSVLDNLIDSIEIENIINKELKEPNVKHKVSGKVDDYRIGYSIDIDLENRSDSTVLSNAEKEKVIKSISKNLERIYDDEYRIEYIPLPDSVIDRLGGRNTRECFINALNNSKTVGDFRNLIIKTVLERW